MRTDGRLFTQHRPMVITPHYLDHPLGSALIENGGTKVLCSVSVEEGVPHWMKAEKALKGWLTAEYSMIPGSTSPRNRRDKQLLSGRTKEIQRLIGRSLRGVTHLGLCPGITFHVDCDVLQADGGTRTAAITGAYVALRLAVDQMLRTQKLEVNPIMDMVAAVGIGLKDGEFWVDVNHQEDSSMDLDMNVVMTQKGQILEIQGSAERQSFRKDQIVSIIDLAEQTLAPIFDLQNMAIEGLSAER